MEIEIRSPKTELEWVNYYDLRYRILRQPWNQPIGSEKMRETVRVFIWPCLNPGSSKLWHG